MTTAQLQPTTISAAPGARRSNADRIMEELTSECETTRRLLERVPDAHLHWKPHEKSMTLGQLALHLAQLPLGITMLVEPLITEMPNVPLTQPATQHEIVDALDAALAYAVGRLTLWRDADLDAEWTLTLRGNVLMTRRRGDLLRTLMLNHSYHHRGQLSVYLRLLDVPLPPIYGPTADEKLFA